jgi:hypothetical protein
VHLVALGEEQFGEVAAVLPGDAGDECLLHVGFGGWGVATEGRACVQDRQLYPPA